MRVAVKDACILIDLANGGVLDAWFELAIETHTTDLVIRQVKREDQWAIVAPFVKSAQLQVRSLSGNEIAEMLDQFGNLPIGVEDQSVLFLAKQLGAILLTGDRRLRFEGEASQIECHGVLWILDLLVDAGKVTAGDAGVALKRMLKEGARLPEPECQLRLAKWLGD